MQGLVAEVLAAWRHAERLAEELEPGSRAHEAALIASERLRDLYHQMIAAGIDAEDQASVAPGEA